MSDILVDIPDELLPKLASLYEERAPWAPWMVGFVHSAMNWKKSSKYRDYVTFMSPNNSWREDGTIIATITCFNQDIFVFTLDNNCTNLYKGLIETKRLNFKSIPRSLFYTVHEKHIPVVKKYIEEKKLNLVDDVPCYIYAIEPEEAKKFHIGCPSDAYIKKLDPQAAIQINDVWPHKFPHSEDYLSSYIEINGGYGTFLKNSDKMVAWVIKHAFGQLAMLQTAEDHARKGYGSLMVKALSKEIAEEGHWPLGTILINNKKSINMFEKLGFKNIGLCSFFVIK